MQIESVCVGRGGGVSELVEALIRVKREICFNLDEFFMKKYQYFIEELEILATIKKNTFF